MITFEKVKALRKIYNKAYLSFLARVSGEPYNEEDQYAAYNFNCQHFEDEFYGIFYNDLSKTTELKAYIQQVYYNEICSQYLKFMRLRDSYLYRREKDRKLLLSGGDELYNRISKCAGNMAYLAELIYTEDQKHKIANLKHYLQIALSDYNISGEYIPLFKSSAIGEAENKEQTVAQEIGKYSMEKFFTDPDDWEIIKELLIENEIIDRQNNFVDEVNSRLQFHALILSLFKNRYFEKMPSQKSMVAVLSQTFHKCFELSTFKGKKGRPHEEFINRYSFIPRKKK